MESRVIGLLTACLEQRQRGSCTGIAPEGNGTEVIPQMKAESGIMNEDLEARIRIKWKLSDHKPALITHWKQRFFSFAFSVFSLRCISPAVQV
jgi:hypothetical protein